jgi:UDP-N-acetylmuramyl pentapeptide phosphotransferase/UDP-N-acetylglucosamine-1-phosphate transferase
MTGMGLVLVCAFMFYGFSTGFTLPDYFVIGVLMLATVSFIDDLIFLKHSLRFLFQIMALLLMLWQLPITSQNQELLVLACAGLIFGIGVINAFNFMDGINGMLLLNCFVILGSFFYLNEFVEDAAGNPLNFTDSNFILSMMIAVAIMAFLNVRNKAVAFMGDVGSMTISIIILYLMYSLLLATGNYIYLLLFSIFGIDAGLTVGYKLILRQNIFVPHRDFLFKRLVHIARFPHLKVSIGYALVQLFINALVLMLPASMKYAQQLSLLFIGITVLVVTYVLLRNSMVRRK